MTAAVLRMHPDDTLLMTLRDALIEELGYGSAAKYRSRIKHLLEGYRRREAIEKILESANHSMAVNAKFRLLFFSALVFLCVPLCFLGCGKGVEHSNPTDAPSYPDPGEMKLVAVEPLTRQAVSSGNLIVNGSIGEWWAGAPAPDGWHPPRNTYSAVLRESKSQEEGFRGRQIWHRSDTKASLNNLLYAETGDVESKTRHRLSVTGAVVMAGRIVVSLWESEGTKWQELVPDFIVIEATEDGVIRYTRDFETGEGQRLAIAVQCEVPTGKKTIFDWYDWSLTKISGDGVISPSQTSESVSEEDG